MSERPAGELEIRSARLQDVSWPERTIELVCMPYDEETVVAHKGGLIREVCAPGAFAGIERRANRIRVNRDHDVTRTIGRAVAFHPNRPEGLVAELRIAKTDLGDETLTLAEDGILDASAGFLPMPRGEEWPERNLRRLTKVWLSHIAMVPDPAYEGASVLAVRSAQAPPGSATPNLDLVRAWRLEELVGSDPLTS